MATMITEECINCGVCEPECPNTAIYEGGVEWELESTMHDAISEDIYYIVPEKCLACQICMRKCPMEAIIGGKNRIHVIDQEKCDGCGSCFDVCPPKFDAVVKYSGAPVPVTSRGLPRPPGINTLLPVDCPSCSRVQDGLLFERLRGFSAKPPD